MPRLRAIFSVLIFAVALLGLVATYFVFADGDSRRVRLSTGTEGGTYAAFGAAFAATLGEAGVMQIETIASAGAIANAQRLAAGEADIGLIQSDTAVGSDVAILARLFPEVFHLIARTDSGIVKVSDLTGKTVALMPEGAGSNELFGRLLAHYEIDPATVDIVKGTLAEGGDRLAAGEVDALFMVVALGNASIERMIELLPVRLIPVDQAEAMAMFDPALRATTVPVGTYSGDRPVPDRSIEVVTVDSLLAVRRSLPSATAEALTRALFEERQQMVRVLPQAAFIAAPTTQDRLAFGVHPGAEAYYSQGEPPFIVRYAEPMAFVLTALALLLSGLWRVRVWLSNARKNRADHYNLAIVDAVERIDGAQTSQELESIRSELFEIFRKVITDLDVDRIEERSLVSFSFAWQVAASTLNHRQIILTGRPTFSSHFGADAAEDRQELPAVRLRPSR